MRKKQLSGKICWVTGAGRGLGRAMAEALAAAGAQVILSASTTGEIEHVASQIVSKKGKAWAIACDVQNSQDIQQLVRQVKKTWSSVDILINNAGTAVFAKIIDTREDDWDQMMATNLRGAFLCSKAVLPEMIARQSGHIIHVVSVAGKQPYFNCGAYCASKYGLLGFTDVLRLETRRYGIRVTALMPGATDTAIWGNARVDRSRMMQPGQVAETVVALCASDESTMIEEIVLRPIGGDLP
ncbi:SDR family oxidoreductase [candidate division KSB1 bacterium]|nr:SDR family oxidoreductase [candidate division KSB1 bacterium]